ncbi:hypothetical protein CE91St41_38740 [Oscillospiraceae bacterium]|nr:hypothetical protein CE91St40_38720 [Oscillospiraceae bacterium]BDF76985.1 hypothetical protein CE91St41_38740 [Oscillospiraceae bacterium]
MSLKYDFSGWATRNDLVCADGRTIRHNAFEDCDGKTVPLVWNHQHDEPGNILGHALLENRKDGVYAYCTFNETESGKAAKELVKHGDIASLSIYANGLKQTPSKDVMHGVIREVSLVVAGANPGAFIDFVDMAHGEGGEQEMILSAYEPISLYRPDEKPPLVHKAGDKTDPEDEKKEDKPKDDGKEEKAKDEKTVQDVVDSMTEEQKTVMYALIGAAMEELDSSEGSEDDEDDPDKKSDNTKGGNKTMKHNVFEQREESQDTVLSHSDRKAIIDLAKSNSVGSLRTALNIYAEQNELKHGIDNIESLFPDFKDLRPGAPERVTRDQGWVTVVMQKVHKSPISRIRTRQTDARNDNIRGHGYQKGKRKQPAGNMNVITRTTDPQTVYRTDALYRDDIVDITDFDVVEYQYATMRENLNEEVATAIMIGDGREPDDEMKISEDHIRSIWNDNDLYTIHYDVDIEAARSEIQGSRTDMNFGENYIYSEAIITAALYAREKYKGTGTPDFFCTPHLVNVMLLARDMNGRRIYTSRADLAAALNVGELHTAEQFEGRARMDSEGKQHKLLGLFVNLADYTVGSTKGGEITRFDQFDIDFNQQKYLIETRMSGALTRVYSAIALEEPVPTSAGGGQGSGGLGG